LPISTREAPERPPPFTPARVPSYPFVFVPFPEDPPGPTTSTVNASLSTVTQRTLYWRPFNFGLLKRSNQTPSASPVFFPPSCPARFYPFFLQRPPPALSPLCADIACFFPLIFSAGLFCHPHFFFARQRFFYLTRPPPCSESPHPFRIVVFQRRVRSLRSLRKSVYFFPMSLPPHTQVFVYVLSNSRLWTRVGFVPQMGQPFHSHPPVCFP